MLVHNAKLGKWFFIWLAIMVVTVFLTLPDERPAKIDLVGFETTESSELYFKNVRSFYYETSEEGEGIFEVYRLASLFEAEGQILPFALYNNWRTNEAYVRLDTTFIKVSDYDFIIVDSASVTMDTLLFPQQNNESQYLFAKEVYKHLDAGRKVGFSKMDSADWMHESTAISVKRTLTDYFRLLDKI
jgi:hypothetical protein